MKHRDDKIARAAHIKARTEGTSNEISFSVLDAAKYAIDNERRGVRFGDVFAGRGSRRENTSDVSRETSEVGAGERKRTPRAKSMTSVRDEKPSAKRKAAKKERRRAQRKHSQAQHSSKRVSLEEEIARRKARRRLGRIAALSTVAVVTMAVVCVGVWLWHVETTEQQGYEAQLMKSLELVSQADDEILQIDAVLDDPFSEESKQAAQEAVDSIPGVVQLLDEADRNAREASDSLQDPTVKNVANQAVISVAARQTMMQQAKQLLDASLRVDTAAQECAEIWSGVLEADEVTHEASKLVEADDPASSKEKTQQAQTLFEESLTRLQAFQASHDEVDLSVAVSYVEKRIEAAGYAIAADDALVERNKEEALAQNDLCNKAETEAATLASKLPSDMEKPFHDAYSERWSDLIKSYAAKRAEAGTSDAVIRDYLGAQGK